MSNAIDMTLDDLIKKNKQARSAKASGGGGGGSRNPSSSGPGGPTRRSFKRRANRPAPYSTAKVQAPDGPWAHDMFADHAAAYPAQAGRAAAIETGTKLYVSNLDYGVSNEDIKELFSEVGDLKKFGIHYDRSGRSKGTADVVFSHRADALAAVKRYNDVQLDGKPMKIEFTGTNISTPAATASVGMNGKRNGAIRSSQGRGRARGTGQGARRGGHGGRGGRGRGHGEKVSAEDLDADLEKYHSEAMQTN